MQKQFYFLSPVEVVKVSSQNLQEVAEWCGGKVAQTESRRVPGRLDSYVWVPTPKGSNISWAFPGMFITKRLVVTVKGELRATWAVFRRDYFEKNYFEDPKAAVDKTWELEDRSPKPGQNPGAKIVKQASSSEPIQEPAVTTADAEVMDDETRERIEQVNREILSRGTSDLTADEVISQEKVKAIAQQVGLPPTTVQAIIDAPVTKTPVTKTPVLGDRDDLFDLLVAVKLVQEELGGEIIPPETVTQTPTGQAVVEALPVSDEEADEIRERSLALRRIQEREDQVETNG